MNIFVEEISKSNLIQSLEVELHLMGISNYAKLLFKENGISSGVDENPVCLLLNQPGQQTAGLLIHVYIAKSQKCKVIIMQWKKDLTNSKFKEVFFKEKRLFKRSRRQKKG